MKSFIYKAIAFISFLVFVVTICMIFYGIYNGTNESDRVLQGLILQTSLIIQHPGTAAFFLATKLGQLLIAYLFFFIGKWALKKSR